MLTRVKQVWAALFARLTPAHEIYIAEHLSSREQQLFWQMAPADQYHALQVTKTAMAMAAQHPGVNEELLRKAALLHDVGKQRGDISTIDKMITVTVHFISPRAGRSIARPGKGNILKNLRHAFYIYGHHARRGAKLAHNAGVEAPVADWIRRHHQKPAAGDAPELRLLQEADGKH